MVQGQWPPLVELDMTTLMKNGDATKRFTRLVDQLSATLRRTDKVSGPARVIENQIAQTKSVHIVVIWDEWKELPPTSRSKVILEAYSRAKRLRGSTITVAMGLTGEEALRMGFLPYSIVTTRRQGDKVAPQKLTTALAHAGGIILKVGSSTQLRFPTLEQAEEVYRQLTQEVPGPYWAIVHEVSASE